jgi:hypothetical protein
MNIQRGILPALILGGLAAASALFVNIRRSAARPAKRRTRKRSPILVRVTENGRKYHRDNCPLLHGATRSIPVIEALLNYEPCKACHPPGDDRG